jgi:uncharacterized protein YndB with AHSA1/START domain
MATLTRSVTIDAPVEKVFDHVLDIRKFWAWPDMALAEVTPTEDGVGSSARIWTHFLGFHMEGGLEYTEVVRPERIRAEVGFAMEHPTWTFTFEPVDDGTKLTARGEWHVKVPAVGRTFERLMVKEHKEFLEQMLAKVKAELEAQTPAVV